MPIFNMLVFCNLGPLVASTIGRYPQFFQIASNHSKLCTDTECIDNCSNLNFVCKISINLFCCYTNVVSPIENPYYNSILDVKLKVCAAGDNTNLDSLKSGIKVIHSVIFKDPV